MKWSLAYFGPHRDITVDTLNGVLTFDSKDWLIGKRLYVKRSYETGEMHSAIALLRKEGYLPTTEPGTVVDVGANIGMTCIALLKWGYFDRAAAFEPAPNSYRLLVKNIQQNGLTDKILHFPYALSSMMGQSELELSHDNSGNHRLRRTMAPGAFREEQRQTVTVNVKTLDAMRSSDPDLSKSKISLIWLDVEGHEGSFFLGAQGVLKEGIPVVTEFWPYALDRSGTPRSQYCQIVSSIFTHFYTWAGERYEKHPIAKMDALFDSYTKPREMCQIILVRDVHNRRPT